MRIAATIRILALAEATAQARGGDNEPSVTSVLTSRISIPSETLMWAQSGARKMFARAGVRLDWRTNQAGSAGTHRAIIVEIISNTPAKSHPGALAYAQLYDGSYVRVFYDRIENPYSTHATGMLLAHVLVHEITHIIEGSDRHAQEGVMKARWTHKDLVDMTWRSLPFASEDIRLLHDRLNNSGRQTAQVHLFDNRNQ
jgi:hypothetical protein